MLEEAYTEFRCSCSDLLSDGDFEGILKKVEEDFGNYKNSTYYWALKGFALGVSESFEEALETLDKALQLDNTFIDAHGEISWILVAMERWEEALEHIDYILKIHPDHEAINYKEQVLLALGGDKELKEFARKEVERWEVWLTGNPNALQEEKSTPLYLLSHHFHTLGEQERELFYFDRMCETKWGKVPPHLVDYREELTGLIKDKKETE